MNAIANGPKSDAESGAWIVGHSLDRRGRYSRRHPRSIHLLLRSSRTAAVVQPRLVYDPALRRLSERVALSLINL